MWRMLHVFQRMAVRTKHFQVVERIVLSVSIFVVYAEYLLMLVVPTSLALSDQVSGLHVLSNSSEVRLPLRDFGFVYACSAAINPLVREAS